MLNYIAKEKIRGAIINVCKEKNILILYETNNNVYIEKYIKETNINFNVIRYFVIDLSCIIDLENLSKIISQLKIMYPNIKIIVVGSFEKDLQLFEQLYSIGIYNLVNVDLQQNIEVQLSEALSDKGIQKKQVKIFDQKEQLKYEKHRKSKETLKRYIDEIKKRNTQKTSNVYFFFLELITRIIKLIVYILLFVVTSIGITVLFNEQLRNMLFQILGLE